MTKTKVFGAIALAIITLFVLLTFVHGSGRPVLVSDEQFLAEYGYKMPKLNEMMVVTKLSSEPTWVVSYGFRKEEGGKIYVKVVSPIFMLYKPFLNVTCENLKH